MSHPAPGSLFWEANGTPKFSVLALVSVVPLVLTGRYSWAVTAFLAAFLGACCQAVEEQLDAQSKLDIKFNIIGPEDVVRTMEQSSDAAVYTPQEQIMILSTALERLAVKYHKLQQQQKNHPVQEASQRKQEEVASLALLCQQAAFTALQNSFNNDQVVAGAISLLALVAPQSVVQERHIQEQDVYGLHVPLQCVQKALERAQQDDTAVENGSSSSNNNNKDYTQQQKFHQLSVPQQQAELQRKACLWLGALCNRGDSEASDAGLQDWIVQQGGMSTILDAIDWYRCHSGVVGWGLWALFQICSNSNSRKAALVSGRGMSVVGVALKNTAEESDQVARHGLALILDVLQTPPEEAAALDMHKVKHVIMNASFHSIVVQTMKAHPDQLDINMMGQTLLVGTMYRGKIPEYKPEKKKQNKATKTT